MHFVIFGGTGDLSQRKLIPSLYHMYCDGALQSSFKIHIVARGDYDDASCCDLLVQALIKFAVPANEGHADQINDFIAHISYHQLDVYNADAWHDFAHHMTSSQVDYAFYMAVPPSAFAPISTALYQNGLAGGRHVLVVEKPLGEDAKSAREINDILTASFDEEHIYRIDHYLGKESVKSWADLRLAHAELAENWSDQYIEKIDITIMETVGVEGRFEYLDRIGVLRDMVQNHMLQVLALTMMDVSDTSQNAIKQAKIDIMHSLKPCQTKNVTRGQYSAGEIDGEMMPAYLDEISGQAKGEGETYIALRSFVDTDRWRNTNVYLRMGKRMARRQADITLTFTQAFIEKFDLELPYLQVNIQPDKVMTPENNAVKLFGKTALIEQDGQRHIQAYEALLRDLQARNKTFFVHGDENQFAWEWVDSIRADWQKNNSKCHQYAAGSYGPNAANEILKTGHKWHEDV